VAITNASGVLQQTVAIDFGAQTMSVNGGAATSFTPSTFVSSLNTALGSAGTATFTNGVLSLSATGSNGVAIADDATTPSQSSNGEGFSQFFGLNNLIESSATPNYNTGLTASSPNTFAAGGTIDLELSDSTGAAIRQASLTIPATATTIGNVISGLNASVGAYGSFSLDSKGQLTFTPAANSGVSVSVVSDTTANSVGGLSLSQTFGIGTSTRAGRAGSFSIRSDIANNPSNLAMAQLDLTQSIGGSPALAVGDGSGATAIANSGAVTTSIPAAGAMAAMQSTVSNYGAELSGQVGNSATAASNAQQSASALLTQANSQRSSSEGVNLDQELVNLTVYQQSYQACSRLVMASNDMYNTLLQMV
jgi:flagellar hook-associated protein 1 FlgK